MGIQKTKEQMVNILADPDNRVVALKGRWGTGKTHLLREVREASPDANVRDAITVSLFGLREINQVKLKLIQGALPAADNKSKQWKDVAQAFGAIKKVLVNVHGGFSAIDELALLAVPKILKGKVIVLDDVERKHPDLSIDEILGFIDEFTQEHDARFVLVLNTDQLNDHDLWTTLAEKVIDQEVRLSTEPAEAFDVAQGLTHTNFVEPIKRAVVTCGITNIRVIRKAIKTVNRILGDQEDLPAAVLARAVPSAVLLAATHYKGIVGGPTTEYILATGHRYALEDDDAAVTGDKKSNAEWDLLISELGILACDEYELLVTDLLKSGLVDSAGISAVVDRYVSEQQSLGARQQAQNFLRDLLWNHRLTAIELVESAALLIPIANRLDAPTISALAERVGELSGGDQVAGLLIDAWIAAVPPDFQADPDFDSMFPSHLHPRIEKVIEHNTARAQSRVTILDVCTRIVNRSSWGTREELAMRAATPDDFENTIRTIDEVETFQLFIRKMLGLVRSKAQYERHFGSAMDNFVEACRRIVENPGPDRLATIVGAVFNSAGLQHLLARERSESRPH